MRWFLLCMFLVCLVGCNSAKNPVIEDGIRVYTRQYTDDDWVEQEARVGVLATTAQRRVIIVSADGKSVCAEPSPDAVDDLISSVTGSLEASLNKGAGSEKGLNAEAAAEIASSITTSAQFLIQRSQGVQFFRDGSFALCLLKANGGINSEVYARELGSLRNDSVDLIMAELKQLVEKRDIHQEKVKANKAFDERVKELKKLQELNVPDALE